MTRQNSHLLESVATPILVTARADGTMLFINAAARKLFDLQPHGLWNAETGAPHLGISFYAEPQARRGLLRALEQNGMVDGMEIEFRSQQGRRFWGLVSTTPIEMDGTEAMLSSIVDISQQKAREMQLAQATDQLRNQAAESLLLNRQLRQQQQVAIAANRAKSDFLARMSHELRSPLNAILGFSEIIADDLFGAAGTQRYQNYAQNIHDAGAHLLALINDILDLSKVEAGRMDLKYEPINLHELIDTCLPLTAALAEKRKVTVRTNFHAENIVIEADHLRLRQVVLNLASNAVKFTLAGGEVVVSTSLRHDRVVIDVADSGIGMSPEQVEVALQPFGQVLAESPFAQVGTGLGLPIVVSLIDMHRGRFDIESKPNVGTRVTITLPQRKPQS